MNSTVGFNRSDSIGKNHDVTVGTKYSLTVGSDKGSTIEGINGPVKIPPQNSTLAMDGKTLAITIPDSITLTCGKSVLKMIKDGTVTINGVKLTFTADGGPVQINGKDVDMN
jgi:hypothetical protein